MTTRRLLAIGTLLAAAALLAAKFPVTLRYRFAADQPVRYRIDYTGQGTVARGADAAPHPVAVEFRSRAAIRGDRAAPPAGTATDDSFAVQVRMEAFSHVLSIGPDVEKVVLGPGVFTLTRNGKVVADLADGKLGGTPEGREYIKLGLPIVLSIDARGTLARVEGLERFESLFPQLALRDVLTTNLARLPADPVGAGGSWDATIPLALPYCPSGGCALKVRYAVVGAVRSLGFACVRLKVEGRADLARGDFAYPDGYDLVAGSETRYRAFTQTVAGEVDFAPSEGIVVRSDLHVRTRAEATYAYAESGLAPTEVPVRSELAVDSTFKVAAEKERGLWERVRGWFE